MRHRLWWIIHLIRAHGQGKEDEHPTYAHSGMVRFIFYNLCPQLSYSTLGLSSHNSIAVIIIIKRMTLNVTYSQKLQDNSRYSLKIVTWNAYGPNSKTSRLD